MNEKYSVELYYCGPCQTKECDGKNHILRCETIEQEGPSAELVYIPKEEQHKFKISDAPVLLKETWTLDLRKEIEDLED